MSETYLDHVTNFMMETALSGGTPPADVTDATGDQRKAVYWIAQADLQIQREWINWDFMWGRANVNLTVDSTIVPSIYEVQDGSDVNIINMVKRETLAIIQADNSSNFPMFCDWNNTDFARLWTYETQSVSNYPPYWSMRPDRTILLSNPVESESTAIYDYLRKPRKMRVNGSISLVPDDFTRLIVVLAKIMYAEHEDAPEVSAGSHEEYESLLDAMESAHLPDQGFNRESHSDADLVVTPE